MEEERGHSTERLVVVTGAVVAIAITLLALALTDIGPHLVDACLGPCITEKSPAVLGFAVSLFVIARLWRGHHPSPLSAVDGMLGRPPRLSTR